MVRNADPAVTTESASKPFGSSLTNTYDQRTRSAVVDVRTQFARGDLCVVDDGKHIADGF